MFKPSHKQSFTWSFCSEVESCKVKVSTALPFSERLDLYRWPSSSSVLTQLLLCVYLCLISSFYKEISHIGLRVTHMISLINSLKALSPNTQSHSELLGVSTSTYEFKRTQCIPWRSSYWKQLKKWRRKFFRKMFSSINDLENKKYSRVKS